VDGEGRQVRIGKDGGGQDNVVGAQSLEEGLDDHEEMRKITEKIGISSRSPLFLGVAGRMPALRHFALAPLMLGVPERVS
jgi:hypothetical protein